MPTPTLVRSARSSPGRRSTITAANCPRIQPTLFIDILPDVGRAACYRAIVPRGSLRDYLHQASPLLPYSAKYGRASSDPAAISAASSLKVCARPGPPRPRLSYRARTHANTRDRLHVYLVAGALSNP